MTQLLEIDTPHSTDDGAQPQIPHVPPEPMMARLAGMKTIVGIGGVALLLLVAFIFVFSSKSKPKVKGQAKQHAPTTQQANQPGSVTPRNEMAPTSAAQEDVVSAQDIDRTKDPNRNTAVSAPPPSGTPGVSIGGAAPKVGFGANAGANHAAPPKQLGSIPPYPQMPSPNGAAQPWSPQPYDQQVAGLQNGQPQLQPSSLTQDALRDRKEQVAKTSLVFTKKVQPQSSTNGAVAASPTITNFGLRPGFHVAVRLESVASTASTAPVAAVVEYNYSRDGQILIPAGSRAIGKIDGADAAGHVSISFSSLELPDGYAVPISAVGLDSNMQSVRGAVTGKQRGKGMLISTLSGIGQTAAMVVGGNTSSALSQNDMMRQRLAQNAGGATDVQVTQMMVNERIVVSVPAGTKMSVIFVQPASSNRSATQNSAQLHAK